MGIRWDAELHRRYQWALRIFKRKPKKRGTPPQMMRELDYKYSEEQHGISYIKAIETRHHIASNAALQYYRIMRRRCPSKYPIMGGTMMKLRGLMANRWRVQ